MTNERLEKAIMMTKDINTMPGLEFIDFAMNNSEISKWEIHKTLTHLSFRKTHAVQRDWESRWDAIKSSLKQYPKELLKDPCLAVLSSQVADFKTWISSIIEGSQYCYGSVPDNPIAFIDEMKTLVLYFVEAVKLDKSQLLQFEKFLDEFAKTFIKSAVLYRDEQINRLYETKMKQIQNFLSALFNKEQYNAATYTSEIRTLKELSLYDLCNKLDSLKVKYMDEKPSEITISTKIAKQSVDNRIIEDTLNSLRDSLVKIQQDYGRCSIQFNITVNK